MKYLTYSGNHLINAKLPDNSGIYYPQPAKPGVSRAEIPEQLKKAVENPLGMPPLKEQVNGSSKILIAFDNNCQPFPMTKKPDMRQVMLETLLPMLYSYGVAKNNIQLICAGGLHRKMKTHELAYMLGRKIMNEFYPYQLRNFDAEDRDNIVDLGKTGQDEIVEVERAVVESDLVIYVDTIQIPLNGGHKSVAVGMGTYNSIAPHHSPNMTAESPHVMQPGGSNMHDCIERMSRIIQDHSKIMVIEAAMNNQIYPPGFRQLGKPNAQCNGFEKILKTLTPPSLSLLPEALRYKIFKSIRTDYEPIEINAGTIDGVHPQTLEAMKNQLMIDVPKQFSTMVFGLPDMSPYAIGARINPVLVVSDILGYVFNWFYNKPLVKKGGVVIILNPTFEVFHEEYHVPYKKFFDEVLTETTDPFEMQNQFQEQYAHDPHLIDCYRNKFAYHGFHPFTVWYWATYALKYLSKVILVGPKDDRIAKRLGVDWAKNLEDALGVAKEVSGEDDVVALTMPPFLYVNVQ